MKKVLIIGFGKMGNLYSKYLSKLNVKCYYYDPYISGGLDNLCYLDNYNRIIISTPPSCHYSSYRNIRDLGYKGLIYIDKPIIINREEINIFKDNNIFCGMTERYNPVIIKLRELIDIKNLINIKFTRLSIAPFNMKVPVIFDLGIHDLDLYLYLLNLKKIPEKINVFKKSKTESIIVERNNMLAIFEWSHESQKRERKIIVTQKNIVYEADLIDQTVLSYESNSIIKNLYINKSQPLKEIMNNFLGCKQCKARLSHEFMLKVRSEEKSVNGIKK